MIKGVIQRSEGIGFDDPIVKTNGSRLLAVNAGSTEICVLDGESIRWQDRTDDPILNAEISDDGYVTVVTSAKRTIMWSEFMNSTASSFSAR